MVNGCLTTGVNSSAPRLKFRTGRIQWKQTIPNFAGQRDKDPDGVWTPGLLRIYSLMTNVRNIRLTTVRTRVEADLDYTVQFDLGDNPLIGEYWIIIEVAGDAPDTVLCDLKDYALKRGCMGMYTITHAIRLKPELKIIH